MADFTWREYAAENPAAQIDPFAGFHNRTMFPEVFFDRRTGILRNKVIGGKTQSNIDLSEWKALSWNERKQHRIDGLIAWDNAVGLPENQLYDEFWQDSLPANVELSELQVSITEKQMEALLEKHSKEPQEAPLLEQPKEIIERFITQASWEEYLHKEAARTLARLPFPVETLLSGVERRWLWEGPYAETALLSFLSVRENGFFRGSNGEDSHPYPFKAWREHLPCDRIPVPHLSSTPVENWEWFVRELGCREDGSRRYLEDEDGGVLPLMRELAQTGTNIIALNAPKGTGKTNGFAQLKEQLAEWGQTRGNGGVAIRSFHHRLSLMGDVTRRLGIPDYKVERERIRETASLAATIQGGHNISHQAFVRAGEEGEFRILFLDEALASLLTAFGPDGENSSEPDLKDRNKVWAYLKTHIAEADLIYMSDADLPAWAVEWVARTRDEMAAEIGVETAKVAFITVTDRRPKGECQIQFFESSESPLMPYVTEGLREGRKSWIATDVREYSRDRYRDIVELLEADTEGEFPDPDPDRPLDGFSLVPNEDIDGLWNGRVILVTSATRGRQEVSGLLRDVTTYVDHRRLQVAISTSTIESGLSCEAAHFDEVIVYCSSDHFSAQARSQQAGRCRLVEKVTWFVKEQKTTKEAPSYVGQLNEILNAEAMAEAIANHEAMKVSGNLGTLVQESMKRARAAYDYRTDSFRLDEELIANEAFAVCMASLHVAKQTVDRKAALLEQLEWEGQRWTEVDLVPQLVAQCQKQDEKDQLQMRHAEVEAKASDPGTRLISSKEARMLAKRRKAGLCSANVEELALLAKYQHQRAIEEGATEVDMGQIVNGSYAEKLRRRFLVADALGFGEDDYIEETLESFGAEYTIAAFKKMKRAKTLSSMKLLAPHLYRWAQEGFDAAKAEAFISGCLRDAPERTHQELSKVARTFRGVATKEASKLAAEIFQMKIQFVQQREGVRAESRQWNTYPNKNDDVQFLLDLVEEHGPLS